MGLIWNVFHLSSSGKIEHSVRARGGVASPVVNAWWPCRSSTVAEPDEQPVGLEGVPTLGELHKGTWVSLV